MNKRYLFLLATLSCFYNAVHCDDPMATPLSNKNAQELKIIKKSTPLGQKAKCLAKSLGLALIHGVCWAASYKFFKDAWNEYMMDMVATTRRLGMDHNPENMAAAEKRDNARWASIGCYFTLAFGCAYAPVRLKCLQRAVANLKACH